MKLLAYAWHVADHLVELLFGVSLLGDPEQSVKALLRLPDFALLLGTESLGILLGYVPSVPPRTPRAPSLRQVGRSKANVGQLTRRSDRPNHDVDAAGTMYPAVGNILLGCCFRSSGTPVEYLRPLHLRTPFPAVSEPAGADCRVRDDFHLARTR